MELLQDNHNNNNNTGESGRISTLLQEAHDDAELIGQPSLSLNDDHDSSSSPSSVTAASTTVTENGDFLEANNGGHVGHKSSPRITNKTKIITSINEFFPDFENKEETLPPDEASKVSTPRLIQAGVSLGIFLGFGYFTGDNYFVIFSLIVGLVIGLKFLQPLLLKTDKRSIKWVINEFSNDLIHTRDNNFLISPTIQHKHLAGEWRLIVRQEKLEHGIWSSFGVIATQIPDENNYVHGIVRLSVATSDGKDLLPADACQHIFRREGDCLFTESFLISDQDLKYCGDKIVVKCKLEFRQMIFDIKLGNFKITRCFGMKPSKPSPIVEQVGHVGPAKLLAQFDSEYHRNDNQKLAEFGGMTRFLRNRETSTNLWTILNFEAYLLSQDSWGFCSPQMFVCSHGIASIWRMRLAEVYGIFTLELQLRGLPNGVEKVKVWYLVEMMDHYGEFIAADSSASHVKYPTYLKIWSTTNLTLFRRNKLLQRFQQTRTKNLIFRISIHTELALLDSDWVCQNDPDDA